ncbi:conserved hypothetical protein [Streptomyces murinus]
MGVAIFEVSERPETLQGAEIMARKLTNSIRIVVAVVTLALGAAAVEAGHTDAQRHGHHVTAEDKGPTVTTPVVGA